MDSILVDDPATPLITGAILVREISSLGVRGDQLPSGGGGLPSYLFDCADLPADVAVEFRGEVLSHSFPPGFFEYYDDGSWRVLAGCPDGIYSYTFRLNADGAQITPLVTNTVIIGNSGIISLASTMDPFAGGISLATLPAPQLTITAGLEAFVSSISAGTSPSLSFATDMDSFVAVISFYGELPGSLPATLSTARQYKVNPDEHLDAYAIQRQYALSWEKDPGSHLDFSINWSAWLADVPGDSLANMYVTKSAGLAVTAQEIASPGITAVMAKDGVVGSWEWITIKIATTQGRIDERTIKILIRER